MGEERPQQSRREEAGAAPKGHRHGKFLSGHRKARDANHATPLPPERSTRIDDRCRARLAHGQQSMLPRYLCAGKSMRWRRVPTRRSERRRSTTTRVLTKSPPTHALPPQLLDRLESHRDTHCERYAQEPDHGTTHRTPLRMSTRRSNVAEPTRLRAEHGGCPRRRRQSRTCSTRPRVS